MTEELLKVLEAFREKWAEFLSVPFNMSAEQNSEMARDKREFQRDAFGPNRSGAKEGADGSGGFRQADGGPLYRHRMLTRGESCRAGVIEVRDPSHKHHETDR